MDLNTVTSVARPTAREQLPTWSAGDAWLAGGTWLFSEPQTHLTRLIDLTDLKWPALTVTDSELQIAATCTVAQLDALPCPENLDHHFVVDPVKFDYYAMDRYRTVGANSMAGHLAEEVIEANTDCDGRERAPVRMAGAGITPGVVRAREGDLEGAVSLGMRALEGDRKSLPSLLVVSRDLTKVLNDRYSGETQDPGLPRPAHVPGQRQLRAVKPGSAPWPEFSLPCGCLAV